MQLSHKLHSIFVWNCRTAEKPYKLVENSVLFSKLSQNHLQFNAKKGILKEKEKRKTQEKKLRQLAASGDADIVIDGKPAGDNFDLDGIRLKDYEIKFKNGKVYLISY